MGFGLGIGMEMGVSFWSTRVIGIFENWLIGEEKRESEIGNWKRGLKKGRKKKSIVGWTWREWRSE